MFRRRMRFARMLMLASLVMLVGEPAFAICVGCNRGRRAGRFASNRSYSSHNNASGYGSAGGQAGAGSAGDYGARRERGRLFGNRLFNRSNGGSAGGEAGYGSAGGSGAGSAGNEGRYIPPDEEVLDEDNLGDDGYGRGSYDIKDMSVNRTPASSIAWRVETVQIPRAAVRWRVHEIVDLGRGASPVVAGTTPRPHSPF